MFSNLVVSPFPLFSSFRCTPLLLANVCVNCMMYATDEEHLSKDEKQKRINKTVYMQSIIIDLLTTPSL